MVLVTKNDLNISFYLFNPARSNVDLHTITQEDSPNEYYQRAHGQNLAKGIEADLIANDCSSVSDESHIVKSKDIGTVAVSVISLSFFPEEIK